MQNSSIPFVTLFAALSAACAQGTSDSYRTDAPTTDGATSGGGTRGETTSGSGGGSDSTGAGFGGSVMVGGSGGGGGSGGDTLACVPPTGAVFAVESLDFFVGPSGEPQGFDLDGLSSTPSST